MKKLRRTKGPPEPSGRCRSSACRKFHQADPCAGTMPSCPVCLCIASSTGGGSGRSSCPPTRWKSTRWMVQPPMRCPVMLSTRSRTATSWSSPGCGLTILTRSGGGGGVVDSDERVCDGGAVTVAVGVLSGTGNSAWLAGRANRRRMVGPCATAISASPIRTRPVRRTSPLISNPGTRDTTLATFSTTLKGSIARSVTRRPDHVAAATARGRSNHQPRDDLLIGCVPR